MSLSNPVIRQLRVRAVRVPMPDPHQTASGVVSESPLVLADVTIEGGAVGRSIVFTYTAAALKPTADLMTNLGPLIVGQPLRRPTSRDDWRHGFACFGTQGLVGMALSGIDMALWDALAHLHGVPLVSLLGGVATSIRRAARLVTMVRLVVLRSQKPGRPGGSPVSRPRLAIPRSLKTWR